MSCLCLASGPVLVYDNILTYCLVRVIFKRTNSHDTYDRDNIISSTSTGNWEVCDNYIVRHMLVRNGGKAQHEHVNTQPACKPTVPMSGSTLGDR